MERKAQTRQGQQIVNVASMKPIGKVPIRSKIMLMKLRMLKPVKQYAELNLTHMALTPQNHPPNPKTPMIVIQSYEQKKFLCKRLFCASPGSWYLIVQW